MREIRLSVVIPSYKDKYNKNTVEDLLKNSELGDKLEIIVVQDGYYMQAEWIVDDPRVRYVHLGKNRGMRGAINAGVDVARGKFLMRVDEHQSFGKGYDRKLTRDCKPNWIITARRYFLDPVNWKVMEEHGYVDYMKLKISGGKFTGVSRPGNDKLKIEESQAMQGSMWVMPRKWWDDVIGELQIEGYGPLIQDSHEMVFKTWKAGGKLMVDKNTWHAHKHRSFSRTHNNGTKENPANCDVGYAYAIKVWKPYYDQLVKEGKL
jgi:glycosyltransferase involved in cell wall biosynthesis